MGEYRIVNGILVRNQNADVDLDLDNDVLLDGESKVTRATHYCRDSCNNLRDKIRACSKYHPHWSFILLIVMIIITSSLLYTRDKSNYVNNGKVIANSVSTHQGDYTSEAIQGENDHLWQVVLRKDTSSNIFVYLHHLSGNLPVDVDFTCKILKSNGQVAISKPSTGTTFADNDYGYGYNMGSLSYLQSKGAYSPQTDQIIGEVTFRLAQKTSGGDKALFIFFVIFTWITAVCLHEFGHALTAYFGGDHSVEENGYLKLNPLKYTHPVLSILLPLIFMLIGGIGLPGGAVYIQENNLRSKKWKTAVSLAGPLATLLCAIILAIPLLVYERPDGFITYPLIWQAIGLCVYFQVTAFFLNLLPLPPLDGFGAIKPWLPQDHPFTRWIIQNYNMVSMGTFLLVGFALTRIAFFRSLVLNLSQMLGVSSELSYESYSTFRSFISLPF